MNDSSTPLVGIFSDDLTGALDAAAPFAAQGFRTLVSTTARLPEGAENAEVISVNLGTRHMNPLEIANRTHGVVAELAALGVKVLLNKIDSTMRGNPGVELTAALNVLSADHAVLCPAYPQNNRTVQDGILLLFGVPVADTDIGQDRLSPLPSSNVEEIVMSSINSAAITGRIHIQGESGGKGVGDLLPVILTVDARTEDDLQILAERLVTASSTALIAGSAGVAVALAGVLRVDRDDTELRGRSISTARRVLIVTASQRLVVDEQINALGNEIGLVQIEVSVDEMIDGISSESIKRISEMIGRDGVVVLKLGKFDVDGELGISELRTKAETIVRNLGDVVRTVTDQSNPNVLIVIGGDTTSGVLDACEVASLELQGELQPGTVSGVPLSGSISDTLLITRAGGFGDEKSLAELVSLLRTGRSV